MFYQFVDAGSNSFTQYNGDADPYEGRRYGLYKLIDNAGRTQLELLVYDLVSRKHSVWRVSRNGSSFSFTLDNDQGLPPAAPLGVRSWTELQQSIKPSLSEATRQGRVINILDVPGQPQPVWVVELDGMPQNRLAFRVQ